jgi:hypothetical protein
MRTAVTLVVALTLSVLAALIVAALLAEWTNAAEGYILVFLVIAPAALIAAALFLIAGTRSDPKASIGKAGRALLWIVGVLFLLLAAVSYFGTVSQSLAWREVKLTTALTAVCLIIIAAQWLVFRWRLAPVGAGIRSQRD